MKHCGGGGRGVSAAQAHTHASNSSTYRGVVLAVAGDHNGAVDDAAAHDALGVEPVVEVLLAVAARAEGQKGVRGSSTQQQHDLLGAALVVVGGGAEGLAAQHAREAVPVKLVAVGAEQVGGGDGLRAGVALRQRLALVAELAVHHAALLVVAVLVQRLGAHPAQPVIVVVPVRARPRVQLVSLPLYAALSARMYTYAHTEPMFK